MKFDEVYSHLHGIPYISPKNGKILYDFILSEKPKNCLELGFAHGVGTCYIAAALDEIGSGHVTAVDLYSMMDWQKPSIEDLLERTGLQKYVSVVRERTGYTWYLKKLIENNNGHTSKLGFCYIDGPKNWTIDTCAFFLVDKLLEEGGWILFDDYSWRYEACSEWGRRKLKESGIDVEQMGEDEQSTPHIELIFRHIVMQHPDYGEFLIQNNEWAWARKVKTNNRVLSIETRKTGSNKFAKSITSAIRQVTGYMHKRTAGSSG